MDNPQRPPHKGLLNWIIRARVCRYGEPELSTKSDSTNVDAGVHYPLPSLFRLRRTGDQSRWIFPEKASQLYAGSATHTTVNCCSSTVLNSVHALNSLDIPKKRSHCRRDALGQTKLCLQLVFSSPAPREQSYMMSFERRGYCLYILSFVFVTVVAYCAVTKSSRNGTRAAAIRLWFDELKRSSRSQVTLVSVGLVCRCRCRLVALPLGVG